MFGGLDDRLRFPVVGLLSFILFVLRCTAAKLVPMSPNPLGEEGQVKISVLRLHRFALPTCIPYRQLMADIDLLVVNAVNASMRRAIDFETLLACLEGRGDLGPYQEHLKAFFEEVPREAVFRFMLAHELQPRVVLDCYRTLFPPEERCHGDLDTWLGELADAA